MGRLTLLIALTVTSCILSSDASTSVVSGGGRDQASSLTSFLNILQGHITVKDLFNMGPLLRTGLNEIQDIVSFSPLFQAMVRQAAKTNPAINVLNTIVNGKIPSLADVFKVVTTKSENIENAMNVIVNHNPKWLAMQAIMDAGGYTNHAALHKVVEIVAGRKIDDNLIKLKNDKYTVSEVSNFAYQNVLKLAYAIADNYVIGKQGMKMLDNEPIDYQGLLRLLMKADTTNFPTTMITDVHKNPSPNPDSVHFLNDIKTKYPQILAEHDNKKAESAVVDVLSSLLKITDEIVSEAETLGNNPANNVKP